MTEVHGPAAAARVRALLSLGRLEEAAQAAREGLTTNPDDHELLGLLAAALVDSGRAKESLEAAERAVALCPDDDWLVGVLGWAQHKCGRRKEALASLNRAVEMNPVDPNHRVMLAEAHLAELRTFGRARLRREVGSNLLAVVDTHGREAVRLAPHDPSGYLVLSKVALESGKAWDARKWAEKALEIDPQHPVGHQMLGLVAAEQGSIERASQHFVDAGRLDPRSPTATKLLRSLRRNLPISGLALYFIIRAVVVLARSTGSETVVGVAAIVVIAGLVGYFVLWPRWRARRELSDEAKLVLKRDRQLRASRLPFRRR